MQSIDGQMKAKYWRRWGIPLALGVAALAVMMLGDGIAEKMRYQREAILGGELWRMLAGHLLHLGWSHMLMNLVALGLIWALAGDSLAPAAWMIVIISCAFLDSLALLVLNPEVQWYVGLSGVLHGVFLAGALAQLLSGRRDAMLLVAALLVKLAWEQWAGALPGSEAGAGGPVVIDAHLYGAIAGGLTLALLLAVPDWRRRFLQPAKTGDR